MPAQTWAQDLAFGVAMPATAVTNSSSITAIVPDITIPANYMYIGKKLQATMYGVFTTVASTMGTVTWKANWGGTGGTNLATSGALTLVASAAAVAFKLEWLITCTAASTLLAMGLFSTTTALYATPAFIPIPPASGAGVGSLTFTSAQALDFSITMSSAQSTQGCTINQYTLVDLC